MRRLLLTSSLVLVAGTSAYMSIYGLMSVFTTNSEVIMLMGLGMEIGKVLVISHLYLQWQRINNLIRISYIFVIFVLSFLTSVEIAGFLSQSYVETTLNLQVSEASLSALEREASLLKEQISVIDETLAGLPAAYVSRRINERKISGYNEKQSRLSDIIKQKAEIEEAIIMNKKQAGPVFAVAKIIKTDSNNAIFILILLLILVLEPLSIGLTVAVSASFVSEKSKQEIKPQQNGSESEFGMLKKKYNLTVDQLIKITGRKKVKTCKAWLNGTTPIPDRALRAVRIWAKKQG